MGTVIGLDIGTTGVRAVETASPGRSLIVKHAAALPLPAGVIDDGQIKDPALLTTALRALWRRGRFSHKRVRLTVGWHPQVLVRPVDMPWMASRADMAGLVADKAAKDMPIDPSTLYLDHHVTAVYDRLSEDGAKTAWADVAVVGVSKDLVDNVLEAVGDAGLDPDSVDITTFALARLVALASSGPGRVDLLVHLGASTGTIVGVVDGQPVFTQPLNEFAGQALTSRMCSTLGVTPEHAEDLKAGEAPSRLFGARRTDPTAILAAWTTALAAAVCETISYVTVQLSKPVGRVWLAGGGSHLATLAPRIGAEIGQGTQVIVLDPGTWVHHPELLSAAANAGTGPSQDMTVALAATM